MAVVLPESKSEVMEDDQLLPEPKVEEGDEFVELDEPAEKEPAPVVKKTAPAKKEKAADPAPSTDELPDDLKGKSPAQIAKMLKDAQSLIGRQGNELGEFRRKADLLIQASLANLQQQKAKAEEPAPAKEEPEVDDTEFFANPRSALAKAIANDPVIKEIREKLGQAAADRETATRTESSAKFNAAHPDAAEIMQDPEFRTWIEASRVRTALLHRAHSKFDFDAGDEVFGTWKALKGVKKPDPAAAAIASDTTAAAKTLAAAAAAKRKQELSAATAPTGGSAGGGKAEGGKKIYRRADVLRLMEEDPDRYEALATEISLAYSEGRVR